MRPTRVERLRAWAITGGPGRLYSFAIDLGGWLRALAIHYGRELRSALRRRRR